MDFRPISGKFKIKLLSFNPFNEFKQIFKLYSQKILRFICLKQLNEHQTDCIDFEARFCCPKSTFEKNTNWTISSETKLRTNFKNLPSSLSDLRNFFESIHQKHQVVL